ncbi:cellulose biosynthesis cyclic di-GMP-binding regulatory protein BcsB [Desulforamulus aeronauticus]|uniref:Cellulose synthase subunit n=1 Tax=Desulforamulus aeronauticus DSM 10349 TaxID=1121421 RepID=A0A1M6NEI4_9FIRM|nr:cellulose biosynthesis cyclic di-GMP-binding regulatory protein BcsB [Desulforamulus aeronauticus]SHJ94024.1 cellulose synthase subunit [Desulforamulus aeronauticus DSM 10349]
MKRNAKSRIAKLFIWTIIMLLLIPWSAFAQPPVENLQGKSYQIPFISTDQTLNSPRNAVSYWLFMPKGTTVTDPCSLNIHFTFSNTLIDAKSSLTVYINGVALETKGIYTLQEKGQGWWSVTLPTEKIKQNAVNEIKFTSDQRSIEGDCADIDNPDNWVILHSDSYLNITLKDHYTAELSGFYPIYYEGLSDQSLLATDFILSKGSKEESVLALLKLGSSLGAAYPGRQMLDFQVYEEITQEPVPVSNVPARNKVYLGPFPGWQDNQPLQALSQYLKEEEGYLAIAGPTEGTPHYSTVIGGKDASGFQKAINLITNRTLLEQVDQSAIILKSQVQPAANAFKAKEKGVYHFSDFGYSTINLAGVFHQRAYLTFIQPQEIQSSKGSYLNLKFSHSQALISERSVITVKINGTPVASTKLTTANAEGGTLKIDIPEKDLKSPFLEVGIECYNYLGLVDCSKDYSESAWTVIDETSQIVFSPGNVMLQPSLKMFPYVYSGQNGEPAQVALGMPEQFNGDSIEAAVLLATRLGQNTGRVYDWTLLKQYVPTSKQKKMDLIFLGSYQDIKLPEEVKKALAVAPGENNELTIQNGVNVISETLQNKALIQVIRSPWDPARRIYVIMYNNQDALTVLKQALSNKDILRKMEQQLALVNSFLDVSNLAVSEKTAVSVPKTTEDRVNDLEKITHLPWWLVVVLIVLIIAALIALLRLRRVKNEFTQAGVKLKAEQGFTEAESGIHEGQMTEQDDTEHQPKK